VIVTFDTNVLLYAADVRDARKQRTAQAILRSFPDAVLLWQTACEFIASSRKLSASGLTTAGAWDILAHYVGTYRLALPRPAVLETARSLHLEHQRSFWDAMIVGACLDAGVTRLYSEDLPGRKPPDGLEIVNPFA
jgi:predicted nucleic acid-binding protein